MIQWYNFKQVKNIYKNFHCQRFEFWQFIDTQAAIY